MPTARLATEVDDVDTVIGLRIRAQRLTIGITQTQLAKQIGITFQQVQKYEKAESHTTARRLHQIAVALDVSAAFFLPPPGNGQDPTNNELLALINRPDVVEVLHMLKKLTGKRRARFMATIRDLMGGGGGN